MIGEELKRGNSLISELIVLWLVQLRINMISLQPISTILLKYNNQFDNFF